MTLGLQDISLIKNINFIFTGNAVKLRQDHENLLATVAQMNEFMGRMIMMFYKRDALSQEELSDIIKHYTQLAYPNLTSALTIARKKQNPLTPEEAETLEQYINMADRGLPFSDDQINDYYFLVEKVKKEQANPWPLIALGSFLLGLWLGSQSQKKRK